jgi:hypothetical protein
MEEVRIIKKSGSQDEDEQEVRIDNTEEVRTTLEFV